MILRLTMEVKDEVHQNEVLNRVEATGAQLLGVEGIVGGKIYHILPPQTIVPVTPLLDLVEYQKQVIGEAEKRMGVIAPPMGPAHVNLTEVEEAYLAAFDPDGDDKALSVLEDRGYKKGARLHLGEVNPSSPAVQHAPTRLPRTDLEKQIADQFMPDQPEMVEHMPFLTYLAQYCTNILEIGCGHGNGSTRAFERGLKSIENPSCLLKHVTVDIDPERPQVRPTNTLNYWYGSICGDSRHAETYRSLWRACNWEQDQDKLDLIYIDTDHTYEVMQAELNTLHAEGLIHDDVLLVFHDTWMFGEYNRMTDAIKEFAQSLDWTFNDYTKVSHGLGLLYKPGGDWSKLVSFVYKPRFYPNDPS